MSISASRVRILQGKVSGSHPAMKGVSVYDRFVKAVAAIF